MTAQEFLLTRRQPRPDPVTRDELEDKLINDWWIHVEKDIAAHPGLAADVKRLGLRP